MRHPQFPLLFSPLRVGPVTVPNRIVFSAHLTNLAAGNRPGPALTAYYEARARGGAGLIITEEQSVHPSDHAYERLIHAFDPAVVPHYRRLTDLVHGYGGRIFAQISHNGGQGAGTYHRREIWAPSPVADPMFNEVPKAMEASDIASVIEGFGLVAEHCRAGGFDGIELQVSHSSLLRQFLSPHFNRRHDEYGGDLEGRHRLLREVLVAVREAAGPGLAIGVRLPGDEFIAGGLTLADTLETVRILDTDGIADYYNTSLGTAGHSLYMVEGSMHVPPGYQLFASAAIRGGTDRPVVGVGRIKDAHQAEAALRDGHCDLVGMVRQQIADPETAVKSRQGRADEVRLCISCNQECIGREGLNLEIGCILNPEAGHELELVPLRQRRATRRRRVLVVGGGPAGMQSAVLLDRRGHRVTLVEREPELGGQVRLAVRVPNRAEFGDLARNLTGELRRGGTELRLGVEANLDLVRNGDFDTVICCTGAIAQVPNLPGFDAPAVVTVPAALTGAAELGRRVAVIDQVGFHQATSTAEYLAERGHQVTVVTPSLLVGQDLTLTLDFENWYRRALALGIATRVNFAPLAFSGEILEGVDVYSGEPVGMGPFETVVVAGPGRADDRLYVDLRRTLPELAVFRAGDCVAPRRAGDAIHEAYRLGVRL